MHAAQYAEVTHERHLNNLCGYPLCGNPPAAAYRSAKRFVVRTSSRTITETQGNDDEAFCSRKCAIKSNWVLRSLSGEAAWLRSSAKDVELMEELEEQGVIKWEGRRGDILAWAKDAPAAPAKSESPVVIPQPLLPGNLGSLVDSLSIVERETPKKPPSAPSMDPQAPAERGRRVDGDETLPLPLSADILPLVPKPSSARQARRGGAALISGTDKIADAVLDASGKMEEESEESEEEEDWAKKMGWGGGAEVDALFEEARRARELEE